MSVYNGEKYLHEAVESILNQTFSEFEFIIINDGSLDSTRFVLESYNDPRIRLFHQENKGLTKALNFGLRHAKGEYIARQDADDISFPERFQKQLDYFSENPDVGLLGTRYIKIDDKGGELGEIEVPVGKESVRSILQFKNVFCHSSVMFRTKLAAKVGYYDETIKYAQDYDLWLRISTECEIDNHPEILQKWRYNKKDGISVRSKAEQDEYASRIRSRYIRTQDNGSIEFEYLMKLVKSYPHDVIMARHFFDEYAKNRYHTVNMRLTYLQLEYIQNKSAWNVLNELANLYLSENKKSLAYMCLVESLRLNPDQSEIVDVVELLREFAKPKLPEKLKVNKCKISVIMPTYNRGHEIRSSIQSVLSQTFQDYELVIVNDGGDDEVEDIIKSFRTDKIKYYKNAKNEGLPGALNRGISMAEGEYIAYLDDDDIYYPNHLEILFKCINEENEIDCVYSNCWWCYGELKNNNFREYYKMTCIDRPRSYSKDVLFQNNYISTLSVLHKKRCFEGAGIFNTDLNKLMDWDLWLRFSSKYNFKQLDDITGEYRWKQNNMSREDRLEVYFLYNILKNYYEYYEGDIALIISCSSDDKAKRNRIIYDSIIYKYNDRPKTRTQLKELLNVTKILNIRFDTFSINVARSYFKTDPRNCMKFIFKYRRMYLLLMIDLFPRIIIRKIEKILSTQQRMMAKEA